MKYRIHLVTGEILRCEGVLGVDGNTGDTFGILPTDEDTVPIFSAPKSQVIYIAADEVKSDPKP